MDTEWTYIREPIETNSMVLKGLLPETEYQFVVRAVNVHGASPPSHINNPVRTHGKALLLTSVLPVRDETASLVDRISKQIPLLFGFNITRAWNYTSSACFLHSRGLHCFCRLPVTLETLFWGQIRKFFTVIPPRLVFEQKDYEYT